MVTSFDTIFYYEKRTPNPIQPLDMSYLEFNEQFSKSYEGIDINDTLCYIQLMETHDKLLEDYYNDEDSELPFQASLEKFYTRPVTPKRIFGTPFFSGVLNLVAGRSKSGKTYSILQMLHDAGVMDDPTKRVIWLDKDGNITIPEYEGVDHCNTDVDEAFDFLQQHTLKNCIVIVDSLKDFVGDLDSNTLSQEAMSHIRSLVGKHATVILVAHTTIKYDARNNEIGEKIKGNEETIKSKCDAIFEFKKIESKHGIETRQITMQENRLGVQKGERSYIYNKTSAADVVKSLIVPGMTRRELCKRFSSSLTPLILQLENVAYITKPDGQKTIVEAL